MSLEKFLGVRPTFLIGEMYRLDLSWKKVTYKDGVCNLIGAKFSGPALGFAERINDNDSLFLDFYKQYYVQVSGVYIGKLSWGVVGYNNDGTITLNNCTITHDTEVNKVPQLNNKDRLVIDTRGHDREVHAFNLTYLTYVINADGQLYNFNLV